MSKLYAEVEDLIGVLHSTSVNALLLEYTEPKMISLDRVNEKASVYPDVVKDLERGKNIYYMKHGVHLFRELIEPNTIDIDSMEEFVVYDIDYDKYEPTLVMKYEDTISYIIDTPNGVDMTNILNYIGHSLHTNDIGKRCRKICNCSNGGEK